MGYIYVLPNYINEYFRLTKEGIVDYQLSLGI